MLHCSNNDCYNNTRRNGDEGRRLGGDIHYMAGLFESVGTDGIRTSWTISKTYKSLEATGLLKWRMRMF